MADEQDPTTDGAAETRPAPRPATFRAVPTVSLVALGFLALCLSPIAFQGGPWFLLFVGPVVLAVWVVRSRTRVDVDGLHVRRLVGTRSLPWTEVSTLRLAERGWVRAVPEQGDEVALRGIRVRDLGRVGQASGGRISAPTPAEAEAAAEHARELEAARMRVAKLREAVGATVGTADGTTDGKTDDATDGNTDDEAADAVEDDEAAGDEKTGA